MLLKKRVISGKLLLVSAFLCLPMIPRLTWALPFDCSTDSKVQPPKDVIPLVEKQYSEFTGLTAKFDQESYFLGLGKEVKSTGNVAFKKPGMMDWVYEAPDRQRFVADGRTLWFHQPDVNQVTVAEFKNSFNSDLPVSFLLGVGSLSDNFSLASSCYSDTGLVLTLNPKLPDPNLSQFLLLVDRKTYLPTGAKIVDAAGNETKITFAEIKLESSLADSRFVFDIPKGVDVIDQRGKGTASTEKKQVN